MEWNTETQRHRVLFFFERTEFTEQKFGSMAFAYSIYLEAVLNLSCADLG